MAKSDEACGSTSKANSTNSKAKKNLQYEGLNPSNIYLATKYHNDVPEKLVYLHFDDSMMKALKLTPKKKPSNSHTTI
ncbi:14g2 protein [Bracoviriform inaniti]|uniref:14g2 protein n=1 Tax=Bracoviriform inaniti TaxID=36344 RepID=Q8UZC6_9VIRU|nr:14g2 protein [Bracoviriform inaniti]UUG47228.1 ORF15 [Bracoviriform inaniti]CAC82099.3 14g2 protein [Bracoviriform inaniti]